MRLSIIATLLLTPLFLHAQNYEVFVSGRTTSTVKKYDELGTYLGDFVTSGLGGLAQTEDILFHPDGSVLVSGFGSSAIKRYDGITGAFMGDFSSGYTLSQPSKMAMGPDSLIYITQWAGDSSVVRFDLNGNFVDQFTGALNSALMHLWDADTNFYVTEFGNGSNGVVHQFDKDGNDLGIFINSAVLQGPTGMWRDSTGDFFVEDWTTGRVQQFDSLGVYEGIFISGMSQPEGIAFLPNGDMLIGDWGSDLVHRFDAMGGMQTTFTSGNGLGDPNAVKVRLNPTTSIATTDEIEFALTYHRARHHIKIITPVWLATGSVSIYAIDGKLIQTSTINAAQGTITLPIKSKLAPGTYVVQMNYRLSNGAEHRVWEHKLMVAN